MSPEECSCDCHHESPPQTLSRTSSLKSKGMPKPNPANTSCLTAPSQQGSSHSISHRPVPSAAGRKKDSPPTYKKPAADSCSKGAVPKSSATKRSQGAPQVPIRTSSAVKSQSQSSANRESVPSSRLPSNGGRTRSDQTARTRSEQGAGTGSDQGVRKKSEQNTEKVTRRPVRRKEDKREQVSKHRGSTVSSDD